MKFLIDECLSPTLAKLARERGFPESSHTRWLGLAGAKDHVVTRRAVDDTLVVEICPVSTLQIFDEEASAIL